MILAVGTTSISPAFLSKNTLQYVSMSDTFMNIHSIHIHYIINYNISSFTSKQSSTTMIEKIKNVPAY